MDNTVETSTPRNIMQYHAMSYLLAKLPSELTVRTKACGMPHHTL